MINDVHFAPTRLGPTIAYLMPQYSDTWWELRCGVPTASEFDSILTPTGMLSKSAEGYIDQLIADRCQLNPNFFTERPMTRDMANGTNMEPEARRWYSFERPEESVQEVGFCVTHDAKFGCSPDGLVNDDGVLELKCPKLSTHVRYLRMGVLPADYRAQVHGHLIVTGRSWCDFCSYAPGLPGFIIRVCPDEYTVRLRVALDDFWDLYQKTIQKLVPHLLPHLLK